MMHPDQHYEIARLRHQEFVAQAQRDQRAARCAKSTHGIPVHRILGSIALLYQAGTRVSRAVQQRFAGVQALSVREQ